MIKEILFFLQEAFVEKGDITSIRPHNFYVINKIMDRIGVGE